MANEAKNSGIKIEFGKITIDHVEDHPYKSGMAQAQIRQAVTKTYPSARVANSKSDSLFASDDFDLEEGASYTSTRVTWLNVPEGTEKSQVKAKLAENKNARIRREIANDVKRVLTEEQVSAIENDEIDYSLEDAQEKFMIRDSDGDPVTPTQYAQNFFSITGEADTDYRTMVSESEAVAKTAEEALEE